MSRTRRDLITRIEILEGQAQMLAQEGPLKSGHDRMSLNILADLVAIVRELVEASPHKCEGPKGET